MSYSIKLITKHKLLSIVFASVLFTLCLKGLSDYSFKADSSSSSHQPKTIRSLIDNSTITQICEKAPKNVMTYYTTEEYEPLIKQDKEKETSKYVTLLLEIISDFQPMKLLGYLLRVAPFLAFLLFVLVSIISWFFFCCCCCCPCCCCRQKKDEMCCKTVSFIITLTMMGAVLALALYSVFNVTSLFGGFNGFACSIMKLLTEILNGQEVEKIPKWNGITGIISILDDTVDTIKSIQENSGKAFADNGWIENAKPEFEGKLATAWTDQQNKILTNQNPPSDPPNTSPITPTYITQYGPYEDSDTALEGIHIEFSERIIQSSALLKEAENAAKELSKDDTAINAISGITNTISSFEGTFSSLDSSIVVPMNDILDLMNEYGDMALLILFGVMSGFSALIILFLVLLGVCKQNWARFILIILWNFFALFMIILFLVSSLLGIVGSIGLDVVGVAKELLSESNLNSETPILIPSNIASYLNPCLHGDGDLSKMFDLSAADNLDKLKKQQEELNEVKANLTANKDSFAIKDINSKYESFKDNFLIADNVFSTQLATLNDLIKNIPLTDKWVANESKCDGNTYEVYPAAISANPCYVVSDHKTPDKLTYTPDIQKYLLALKQYDTDHRALLSGLITQNTGLNNEFEEMTKKLVEGIDKINLYVLDPLNAVFGEFVGESSVFSIVNCKFFGGHIFVFLDQLQAAIGLNFFNIAIIIGTMCFCLFFGIIFLIISINRCKKQKVEKEKNKSGTNDSNNNSLSKEKNIDSANNIDPELIQIKKK